MRVGCVKEIMKHEKRVGLTPSGAEKLTASGHEVLAERSAGRLSGFSDSQYKQSGARLLSAEEVWANSDLIIKVKQPLEEEFIHMQYGSMIFCFHHLAGNLQLLDELLKRDITALDYGTIQLQGGLIPILAEMSKIAGRKAFFDGAELLMKRKGMMLGPECEALVLGLGFTGSSAAELIAATKPRALYLLDSNPEKFIPLKRTLYQNLSLRNLQFIEYNVNDASNQQRLAEILKHVDLLIGAAHIPGEKQAKLVPEWMMQGMRSNSVAIDISIDQGGCFETSNMGPPGKQIFRKHGVWHYCVPNMPGRVPVDSTPALTKETLPYIIKIAENGFENAVTYDSALVGGVNTRGGWITHEGLAKSIGRDKDFRPLHELLQK